MSRTQEAAQRLEAAFERLERALAAGESSGLAELRAELDDALKRNRELDKATDQVAERLDRVLGRVNAILES